MSRPIEVVIVDDETGEVLHRAPPNDRFLHVTIIDRRRGRTIAGTATLVRWANIVKRVQQRWPRSTMSPRSKGPPILIRTHRGAPVVVRATPLEGPVASVATKH